MIPPGTITYPNAGTAIDLVWGNEKAADNMLKCKLAEMHDVGSDYLPIQTEITITNNLGKMTVARLLGSSKIIKYTGEYIAETERLNRQT